jgi:hypothetical protein
MRQLRLPVPRRPREGWDTDNRRSACAAHVHMQPAGWSFDEAASSDERMSMPAMTATNRENGQGTRRIWWSTFQFR